MILNNIEISVKKKIKDSLIKYIYCNILLKMD